MAKDETPKKIAEVADIDWTKGYLPEGSNAKSVRTTGELMPTYAADLALTEKWAFISGRIHKIHALPVQDEGTADERTPLMIWFRDLKVATKGTRGPKQTRKIVDVPVGGDILVALHGNLVTNRELADALKDTSRVYYAMLRVSGTEYVNKKGNPMYVYDLKLVDDALLDRAKAGAKYLLSAEYVTQIARGDISQAVKEGKGLPELPAGGVTTSGQKFDRDGVLVEQAGN